MLAVLSILIKDFCASLNVVRNMNEDQIIEAALVLLDECGNFRLQDYLMMFQLAKRGGLNIKILDRMDIQIITQMLDAYWEKRHQDAKKREEEEYKRIESLGSVNREEQNLNDRKLSDGISSLGQALNQLKFLCKEKTTE